MKRFMYLSIALVSIAVSFLAGLRIAARSHRPAPIHYVVETLVMDGHRIRLHYVMLSNGNVYVQDDDFSQDTLTFLGNFWAGGPIPTLASEDSLSQ